MKFLSLVKHVFFLSFFCLCVLNSNSGHTQSGSSVGGEFSALGNAKLPVLQDPGREKLFDALILAAETDYLKTLVTLEVLAEGLNKTREHILSSSTTVKKYRDFSFSVASVSTNTLIGVGVGYLLLVQNTKVKLFNSLGNILVKYLGRPALILSLAGYSSSGAIDLFAESAPKKATLDLEFRHRLALKSLVSVCVEVVGLSADQATAFDHQVHLSLKSFLIRNTLEDYVVLEGDPDSILNVLRQAFEEVEVTEDQFNRISRLLNHLAEIEVTEKTQTSKPEPSLRSQGEVGVVGIEDTRRIQLEALLNQLQALRIKIDKEVSGLIAQTHSITGDAQDTRSLRLALETLDRRIRQIKSVL